MQSKPKHLCSSLAKHFFFSIKSTQMIDERRALVRSLYEQFFGNGSNHFLCARILLEQIKLDLASGKTLDANESNNLANHLRECSPKSDDIHGILQRLWLYVEYYLIKFQVYYSKLTNDVNRNHLNISKCFVYFFLV